MRDARRPDRPAEAGAARKLIAYDFAVLRVVPHVHLGTFVPIGVVLHARTAEFLALRAITDPAELAARVPDVEPGLLSKYLSACVAIGAGDPAAGPVALAPVSERFHWLTAPRSDVLQCSPVHGGLCADPSRALDDLFDAYVVRHG